MSTCPWMFLVRIQSGNKPRVCRVDPYEATHYGAIRLYRRSPRAWIMRYGVAAVANSVDDCFKLIESLHPTAAGERPSC